MDHDRATEENERDSSAAGDPYYSKSTKLGLKCMFLIAIDVKINVKLPYISVLIVAYDRKEYISRAIHSVMCQTLSNDFYEIIVITNFEIDPLLVDAGRLKVMYSNTREIGPKISEALKLCNGEILSFLEDDDIWLPNKLETVFQLFNSDAKMGYYHNNWSIIDEAGVEISHPLHSVGRRKLLKLKRISIDSVNRTYTNIRKMVQCTGDFNSSCISIRKEIVEKQLDFLKNVTFCPDTFLFYAALLSDYMLITDSNILTKYRIHDSNLSINRHTYARMVTDTTYFVTIAMIKCNNGAWQILKSLGFLISDLNLESNWTRDFRGRRKLVADIINHIGYISRSEIEYNMILILFALICLIFPKWANEIYENYYLK
ncbi:MAG: glycosyltransferase [Thermoplasmata archaeon]|nr:glycosyltransferase [Candidatus Sysuiplasma jiujiangense]